MDVFCRSQLQRRWVAFALVSAVSLVPATVGAVPEGGPKILGRAVAVDGDTLDVARQRVRLEGIDAPEIAQTCGSGWFGTWPCGRAARSALEKLVSGGDVECKGKGVDKYDRILAVCFVGGRDINAEMVRTGLAWAFVKYSTTYVAFEREARADKAGIWRSESEPAWLYRERRWSSAEQQAPNGCAIKGNVTDKGQIYHLPWSPWYSKVKIEPTKGERWFCSEAEAMAAGWRPAIVN